MQSPTTEDLTLGFEAPAEEAAVDSLDVQGDLPAWLSGSLLRLTPAGLELEGIRHWFDGLAMLHRFGFDEGRVSYANRWLDTAARRAALADSRFPGRGFATDPCRSIFSRIASAFSPEPTDNANVNLVRLGERFVAMTETPMPVEFDPVTLDTLGARPYADGLTGQVTTAHPHLDPARGELVNYVVHFGARTAYRVYAQDRVDAARRLLAEVPVREPSYMQSFAITERFVVLVEFPLVVNPLRLAAGASSFIESYRWRPERGTRITAIDTDTGECREAGSCEAMFAFHHVNAFERHGELVIDLVAYDDPSIIDALYLDRVRDPDTAIEAGSLRRLRVPQGGGSVAVERLSEERLELPRIDYARCNGRPYRLVYAAGQGGAGFFDQLVKVDVNSGESTVWRDEGCHPGEPVYVPRPGAGGEDDGLVLSVVLDPAAGRSFLVVLDAQSFEEVARAEAPHHIPFGFHGSFFGGLAPLARAWICAGPTRARAGRHTPA